MIRALLAAALLALPALATEAPAPTCKDSLQVPTVREYRMVATWYGAALHGRLTSWHFNGRPGTRFDRHALTCAHRSLPFGSTLRVNRRGMSVVVTVTDRGPEAWTGSDLDLSEAAAVALGMREAGRSVVTVEAIP